ncbi:class I SAM-dependent methyltransferase [Rhizobium sp. CC1099]|uniref:class I SAM-dependent methyltransferase n=1 Tax=Rhizobium sp. CC1099 TaxID=3039160 RepID=UPI0024B143DC|nr:class I SAM-dependent methyltransferase [Rhizobium sp. CC1099]WFU89460.1 class I SAM-dependent methyltransferase [Rhizobium sp. CC1099]
MEIDFDDINTRHKQHPSRFKRAVKLAWKHVRPRIDGGKLLEIGAQHQPIGKYFPTFDYWSMDIRKTADNVIVGDITNCPEVESESFDLIVSLDVFEHLNRPWKAAEEIKRLLKPGGIVFVTTIFSWRYHPSPIDYYRYSPDALEFLFEGMETLEKGWDYTERRRDNRKETSVEPVDELGGWRENVRVNYVGQKPVK